MGTRRRSAPLVRTVWTLLGLRFCSPNRWASLEVDGGGVPDIASIPTVAVTVTPPDAEPGAESVDVGREKLASSPTGERRNRLHRSPPHPVKLDTDRGQVGAAEDVSRHLSAEIQRWCWMSPPVTVRLSLVC